MTQPKIFCIGFAKTGNARLGKALRLLGYRVTGARRVDDPHIGENVLAMAQRTVPHFDAFHDNPWPVIYRALDQRYPGSRFILTVRDPEAWIRRQVRHFGRRDTPMRKWIYGAGHPQDNEALYLKRYEAHIREVQAYFKDRPDDFLVIDINKGDGWSRLCAFLEKPVPAEPFPAAEAPARRSSKRRHAATRTPAELTLPQRLKHLVTSRSR